MDGGYLWVPKACCFINFRVFWLSSFSPTYLQNSQESRELSQVKQIRFSFPLPDKLNLFPSVDESCNNASAKKQTQVKFILYVLNSDLLVVRVRVRLFVDAEAHTIGHGPLWSVSNTVDCRTSCYHGSHTWLQWLPLPLSYFAQQLCLISNSCKVSHPCNEMSGFNTWLSDQ